MVYRAIGLMSGSEGEGLEIVFAEFHENRGAWTYTIQAADCYAYTADWKEKLLQANSLSALDYLLLHTEYGHYTGQQVNRFIEEHQLQYKVQLVASHGHTIFQMPHGKLTAQLGDGAAIAAITGINVVSDLRSMDLALGGNGEPILSVGEKLLGEMVTPEPAFSKYKNALVIALIGLLRWREENNMLAEYTGAKRNSIGGAVWIGQEA